MTLIFWHCTYGDFAVASGWAKTVGEAHKFAGEAIGKAPAQVFADDGDTVIRITRHEFPE